MRSAISRIKCLSLVLSCSLSTVVLAQELEFSSLGAQTQLIELYTSQGCSSCPPAEKLLSGLLHKKGLWTDFIPIAFHVDYWNYLGWKDVYSKPSFTQRQRRHHQLANVSNVYTPGFVVDGQEWRGFFSGSNLPRTKTERAGDLTLRWDSQSHSANVSYQGSVNNPAYCYFAILGFEKSVAIQAGENRGLKINQDFIALALTRTPIKAAGSGFECQTTLASDSVNSPSKHSRAIVSWVADRSERPLQATGGWL